MNSLRLLRDARALISIPQRWTIGTGARTTYCQPCSADDRDAQSWCSIGAIARVHGGSINLTHPVFDYLRRGFGVKDESAIAQANDNRTHAEVLHAFDRAIALAEEDTAGAPLPALETKRELTPA